MNHFSFFYEVQFVLTAMEVFIDKTAMLLDFNLPSLLRPGFLPLT